MPGAADVRFEGSVPENYDRYLGPFLFEPYAADLARRLPAREGLRVLEVACGTGIVTQELRRRLPPSATIVATDLNDAMVVCARAKLGEAGVTFGQADALSLPFPDGSFDAVICQFGYMFVPDRPLAFREASRVLAPGGTFLASVWCSLGENLPADVTQKTLARLFPDDPPRFLETPYGCHDALRLHDELTAAGHRDVKLERVVLEGVSPSARDFATGFVKGSPLTYDLLGRGADLDTVVAEVARDLARVGGSLPFRSPIAALVISSTT